MLLGYCDTEYFFLKIRATFPGIRISQEGDGHLAWGGLAGLTAHELRANLLFDVPSSPYVLRFAAGLDVVFRERLALGLRAGFAPAGAVLPFRVLTLLVRLTTALIVDS